MKRNIEKVRRKHKSYKRINLIKILVMIIIVVIIYMGIENNKLNYEKNSNNLKKWEEDLKTNIFHAKVKTIVKEDKIEDELKQIGLSGSGSKNVFFSVYDDKDNIIYKVGKDGDSLVPASIAKIYTLVYVLDVLKDYDKNTKVKSGNEIELNISDASSAGLIKGKEYTINDLISSAVRY